MPNKKSQEEQSSHELVRSVVEQGGALRQIANCLGFIVLQMSDYKDKPNKEQIPFLSSLGFDRNSIAALLGTNPNTVSKELSLLKAAQRDEKAKGKVIDENGTN